MKKITFENFNWKRFAYYSTWMFIATLIITGIWNYFDSNEKVSELLTKKDLIKRIIQALIIGFILAVLIKKGTIEKKDGN